MKNTRMMRYHKKKIVQNRRNKCFYQVTTVVTLLCPMVLGSVSVMAEEIFSVEATAEAAYLTESTLPDADLAPSKVPAVQEPEAKPETPEVSVIEEAEVSTSESNTAKELVVTESAEQESVTSDTATVQAQGNEFEPEEETEENALKVGRVNVILWCADNKNNTLHEETFQVPVNESKTITAPEIAGYTVADTFPAINDPHSMVTTDYQNKAYTVTPGGVEMNEAIRIQFNYRKIVPKNYSATFRTSETPPYISSNGERYSFNIYDEDDWKVGFFDCTFPNEDSDEFYWYAWDIDSDYPVEGNGGRSGQPITFEIGEAKYNITIIADQRAPLIYSTISFAVEGNGLLSDANSIERKTGYYLSYDELPTVTPAAGHRFLGWRKENQEWLAGYGMEIHQDITLTAVFEAGELDWSKYDASLADYEAYVQLKDIYEHFQWWSDWEAWNSIYQDYLEIRNRTDISQKEIDFLSQPLGGMHLNFVDYYFMYGEKIQHRIKEIFDSLQDIYQDTTSYTSASKQLFDQEYLKTKTLLEQGTRDHGVYERELFTAYQSMVDARRNLVRNDGTKNLFSINLVPYPGLSFDGELAPFSNFMIQHSYSDGSYENLYLNKNDYVITTGNDQDVITEEGIIFKGVGRRDIEITYQGYKTGSGYSVLEREKPAEDFSKAKEAMNQFNGLKEADYTPESWKKMQQILANQAIGETAVNEFLQAIIDGTYPEEVSQSWLDWLTETLQTAMSELVKKDDSGNNGNNGNSGNNGSGNNNGSNNGNNSGASNNGGTNNNAGNANNNGTKDKDTNSDNKNTDDGGQNNSAPKNTDKESNNGKVKTVNVDKYSQVNTQGATETKGLPQTGEEGSFVLTLMGISTLGVALAGAFLKSRKKYD
ncbi:LPXTG cell wall anchor domain-containing protein [Candidatus Enterococcus ferrettii]|uniref:Gram-positive cocci surface proteins LPxTG domain-containing protein n=1 Tax=Candidatus Enterococcus ferrettii TaxID=2815324 RepID=A0ABV0EUM3_9ENTE|nr:LPXTG cell wall anchor domain-containing protein [Enterococcus sp. 665A]MBO1339363.1 LPXTG cell wall anchor domain-containing protein [Enterococcus sp. 665A]